jgi:hypothetical protein
MSATTALQMEFEGILSPEVINQLGNDLGNGWTWVEDFSAPPLEQPVIQGEVIALFEQLTEMLKLAVPPHGGIGHNGPPEDVPLTADEHARALRDIAQVTAGVRAGDNNVALDAAKRVWETACKIFQWAMLLEAAHGVTKMTDWAFQYYGLTSKAHELLIYYLSTLN